MTTTTDMATIERRVRAAASELHAQRAYLFGSHARGDARPDSDVDLLFIVEGSESALHLIKEARRRLREWHVPKDVLVYTPEEFARWASQPGSLCHRVQQEGIVVYET